MYKKHWDKPNQQWNVYIVRDGQECFVRSFRNKEEAQEFCDFHNNNR